MPSYVENGPIILPSISADAEGVRFLGDFWNCRTSKKVGPSVFENHSVIPAEFLHVHPRRQQDYRLTHIKSTHDKITTMSVGVSATLVVLRIKMNVGSAKYTTRNHASLTREELEMRYDEETFVVRLLPSAAVEVPFVIPLDATHIVTEVVMGAEVSTSIVFESKVTTKFKDKTSSGLGGLIIGPMSAAVEAGLSALTRNDPDSLKISINFDSNPTMEKPADIQGAFDNIKKIRGAIDEKKEFTQLQAPNRDRVVGVPIRYYLVPVSQFFEGVESDPLYEVIESNLMANYLDMMNTLMDFQIDSPEEEELMSEEEPIQPPVMSYFKKRIVQADFRLKQMLYDSNSEICKEIGPIEGKLKDDAKTLHNEGELFLPAFAKGEKTIEDHLIPLLSKYREVFNPSDVDTQIEEFVVKGKQQLDFIKADDVDDDVKAAFLTSNVELEKWKEGTDFKILVRMSNDGVTPEGILLALYQLSKHLDDNAVGVTLPNINKDGIPFQIAFRVPGSPTFIPFEAEFEHYSLDIVSAALGFALPVLSRFYTVKAAASNPPVVLPLTEETLKDLPNLINDLKADCSDIIICENFAELRENIEQEDGNWKFVMTTDGLESVTDAVENFFNIKNKFTGLGVKIDWIVTTFGDGIGDTNEAPLLFVYQNGILKAVCGDALDMLLLEYHFNLDDIDLSALSPTKISKSCLYSSRAVFASQVSTLFKTSFTVESTPVVNTSDFGLRKDEEIQNAVDVTVAYGGNNADRREMAIVNALVEIVLKRYVRANGRFLDILKASKWSQARNAFSEKIEANDFIWGKKLLSDLYDFTFSQSGTLETIGVVFRTLEECVKEWKDYTPSVQNEEPEIEPPYDPVREIQDILSLLDDNHPDAKSRIEEIWSNNAMEMTEKCKLISEILIGPVIDEEEKATIGFHHFRNLCNLLNNLIDIYEEEARKPGEPEEPKSMTAAAIRGTWRWHKGTSNAMLLDIVGKYITYITNANVTHIVEDVCNGFVHRAVHKLSLLRFESWLTDLQEIFKDIILTPDIAELIVILILKLSTTKLTEDMWAFLWLNSKFQHLMKLGIDNRNVVEELIIHQCKDNIVPAYIPFEIARVLKAAIKQGETSIPSWSTTWGDIRGALNVFQGMVAMKYMPDEFVKVLRTNIAGNSNLRGDFESAGALLYWNARKSWFDEPWELSTVEQAVDNILAWIQETLKSNQNSNKLKLTKSAENGDQSAEVLLRFVLNNFPQYVKNRLIVHTSRQKAREVFKYSWDKVENYQHILALFINIISQPLPLRQQLLNQLETGLTAITVTSSAQYSRSIIQLRNRLQGEFSKPPSPETQERIANLEAIIRQVQRQLNSTNLQLKHFIREFEAVAPELDMPDVPITTERFKTGSSVEVIDLFNRRLTKLFNLPSTAFPDWKVFILCSVGLANSGKSDLMDALFPNSAPSAKTRILSEEGIQARLIQLNEESKSQYGVDAIILIDVAECYGILPEYENLTPTYQRNLERQLVSYAMSLSQLSIIHFTGDRIPVDLLSILEIGLIEKLRQSDSSIALDILLVQSESTGSSSEAIDQFKRMYDQVKVSAIDYQSEFGLKAFPRNRFTQLNNRINGQLLCKANDLTALRGILESTSAQRHLRLKNWVELLTSRWAELAQSTILHHSNTAEIISYNSVLNQMTEVDIKIESCFQHHEKEYEEFIRQRMVALGTKIKGSRDQAQGSDWFSEALWLHRNEKLKAELLSTVYSKLFKIPTQTCTPIGEDQTMADSSCEYCPSAYNAIEAFLKLHPTFKGTIDGYVSRWRDVIWRRLLQLFVNLDLQVHLGLTLEFENIFIDMYGEGKDSYSPSEIQEFIRVLYQTMERIYADYLTAIPAKRTIAEDVRKLYSVVPHILNLYNKTPPTTWTPPTLLLKLQVEDQIGLVLKDYSESFSNQFYEFGMVRKLKERIQVVLNGYSISNGLDYPSPDVRWSAHLYALQNFLARLCSIEDNMNQSGWSPVAALSVYHANISEEIRKRLLDSSAIKQQNQHGLISLRMNRNRNASRKFKFVE